MPIGDIPWIPPWWLWRRRHPIMIIVDAIIEALEVDNIIAALTGKRFAVLGERGVGKTVLINFLTKGTLSQDYIQTLDLKKTASNYFKLKDLKLSIKQSKDVPGDTDFFALWEDIVQNSDIVLYLLRADKLMAGDKYTEERVKRDMGQIGEWLKGNPKKFPLFIIGTHCDLTDPDLTKLPKNERGYYEDKLRKMPTFQEIVLRGGGGRKVRFVFGSLKSKDTVERLVYRIIDQVVNHND